jgi:subtilisin-like proprotein convertase family protein
METAWTASPLRLPPRILAGFDGSNPNGTWNLFVRDDNFSNCGVFAGGWSITIRDAVPS